MVLVGMYIDYVSDLGKQERSRHFMNFSFSFGNGMQFEMNGMSRGGISIEWEEESPQ